MTASSDTPGTRTGESDAKMKSGSIGLRSILRNLLAGHDYEGALQRIGTSPAKLIGPLLSLLYDTNEIIRWRAVSTIGLVVSRLAEDSHESARNIMRRLMWSLNDESGGIGWGAPEAMGEIMASNAKIALEFHRILLSYIDESGNLLEHDQLERGVLWGIGRLAQVRPELVRGSADLIINQLRSDDAVKRGLALWVLSILGPAGCLDREPLELLREDQTEVRIYQDGRIKNFRVADLVTEVLRQSW